MQIHSGMSIDLIMTMPIVNHDRHYAQAMRAHLAASFRGRNLSGLTPKEIKAADGYVRLRIYRAAVLVIDGDLARTATLTTPAHAGLPDGELRAIGMDRAMEYRHPTPVRADEIVITTIVE